MVGVDSLLQDRYRVGPEIASGGMGTVYRATDEKLGREVAIKLLAANLAVDESFVERFRREARASAGLRHPNIANVFDAGEEHGAHFIVMELAPGRDLARLLREEGRLEPERAVKVIDQICLALGHAHAAGIIHRDVKPANVIVGRDDSVKVTDFGIARAADDSKLTATGSVLGSAHYISPEQAEGKPLSYSADIYSLGVVMFEMLTGALPFTGESLMSVAMRHVTDDVPAPSSIAPHVAPELDDIVRRATMKEPTARFKDTDEMHGALGVAAGAPVPAATAPLPTSEARTTVWPIPGDRWDPAALGRIVLVVFALLGLIAIALLAWRLGTADPAPAARPEPQEPTTYTITSDVIGAPVDEVEARIAAQGFDSETRLVAGDELEDLVERVGVDETDAEAGEVVYTDPAPGGILEEGETITLFVSAGWDFDDEDPDPPGKGKAKGKSQGKGPDKDDDKDDD